MTENEAMNSKAAALESADDRIRGLREAMSAGIWGTALECCHKAVELTFKAAIFETQRSTGVNHQLDDLAVTAGLVSKNDAEYFELSEFTQQHGAADYFVKKDGVLVKSEAYVRPWAERAYYWVSRTYEARGWLLPYSRSDFGL